MSAQDARSTTPEGLPDLTRSRIFSLEGKVALITGGGTGLGLMIATAFVQNGARVYISSRKMKVLEEAAARLNAHRPNACIPITSNLTNKAGCDELAAKIAKLEDRLDILVNNSGLSWGQELENFDEKLGWDRVFAVNVKSLFYLTVGLLPLLEKGKDAYHTGSVINIASIYSYFPYAYMPTAPPGKGTWSYLASKAAAAHLTRMMAGSLMKRHVTVNAIAPGFFPSNMTSAGVENGKLSVAHPADRMGSPVDMAGLALLYASSAGAHITGTLAPVDGGMSLSRLPPEVKADFSPPPKTKQAKL